MADALHLDFRRIQFTPDLMPADLIGTQELIAESGDGRKVFEFQKGPLFANVLLADEINRATNEDSVCRCWKPCRSGRSRSAMRPIRWRACSW